MTITEEAAAIAGEVTGLRHALHREPEIGYHLPKTQEKVLAALDGLPLEVTVGKRLSSVTAVLRGGRPGPAVLLRGDMDALPVTEATGLPFSSRIDGVMHACGHDLHTAMLAGAARLLSARQAALPGSVIFMFQPAEEGGPDGKGGALRMLEEGVLAAAGDRPAAAYGMHVFSDMFGRGVFEARPGPTLAASDTLAVTVRGRGGHGSMPHRAADPVPAACAMVTALQTLVTRRFDVFDPVVITVGAFHAGTWSNIIPDEATFEATVRSYSPQARDRLRAQTLRLVRGIAEAHGVSVDAQYVEGLQQLTFECALILGSTLEYSCELEGVGGIPGDLVCDGTSLVRVREAARSRIPGRPTDRDRRPVAVRRTGQRRGVRAGVVG